ncbi:RING/U-box [Gorgonomyces haynaldii]|nr:RING/U-box [Gorgonomyces haynaldii]
MPIHVKINSWKAVAHWKWNVPEDEVCGICRNKFEVCCPACKLPGDDCPLIWGECSHVFHMHCLLKWTDEPTSNQLCPMDRRPWKVKT